MTIAIVALHVFVCLFLIAVILLQAGRGQGLSWGVFGGSPQSILGTRTASFLTRVTTVCAILFLMTCITLNIIETKKYRSLLAPKRPLSEVDFDRIKQALEQAEAAGAAESQPASEPVAETTEPAAPDVGGAEPPAQELPLEQNRPPEPVPEA